MTPPEMAAPPRSDAQLERHARIDEAVHEAAWRRRRRADLRRAVLESALLLTAVVLLIVGLRPLPLAVALLFAGPLVGVAAHFLPAGRARTGLLGALGFAICVPISFASGVVGLVLGTAPAFLAFAVYGIRREFRAHAGWE